MMSPENNDPLFNRKSKDKKQPITLDEYRRIRNVIRRSGGRFIARNLLLVNLQTNTCVSSSDVLKFKTGTVYRQGHIIKKFWINQKKPNKSQLVSATVSIRSDIEAVMKEYCRLFSPNYFSDPNNPLFPTQRIAKQTGKYKPMSYGAYRGFLRPIFAQLGMDLKRYGTHSLRTALPLAYYQKTGDAAGAKAIFNHKSGKTTVTYIEKVSSLKAVEIRKELLFTD